MESTTVGKWIGLIEKAQAEEAHVATHEYGKRSRKWMRGQGQYSSKDELSWKGDLVRGNWWYRDLLTYEYYIVSQIPRLSIRTELADPVFQRFSSAQEAMTEKTIAVMDTMTDIITSFRRARHTAMAWVKLDWNNDMKLPTLRWCDGDIVFDPMSKGMLNRARWVSEKLTRPLSDLLRDEALPQEAKNRLTKEFVTDRPWEKIDFERGVELLYIWSKTGENPWTKPTGRKLIIICKQLQDAPLLVEDWPWPYLGADKFPYAMLRFNPVDGENDGIPDFQVAEPLLKQGNWLASFMMADVRRAVGRKVLASDKVKDHQALASGDHLAVIPCEGADPKSAVHVVEYGPQNDYALKSYGFVKGLHDEQTGVNDITRGISPGSRTTAEEARTLNENSVAAFEQQASAMDKFLDEVIEMLAVAINYYVPQWGRVVRTDPFSGEKVIVTKVWDEGLGQYVDLPIDPEEAKDLPDPSGFEDGYVLRPGVNDWIGVDHALAWLTYDIDQLQRDFSFKVEGGTSSAQNSIKEQRNILTIMQTLREDLLNFQCYEQYHHLIRMFIQSFRLPNWQRLVPPLEKFLMGPASFAQQPMPEGDKKGNNLGKPPDDASLTEQPPEQTVGMGFGPQGMQPFGAPDGVMGQRALTGGANGFAA